MYNEKENNTYLYLWNVSRCFEIDINLFLLKKNDVELGLRDKNPLWAPTAWVQLLGTLENCSHVLFRYSESSRKGVSEPSVSNSTTQFTHKLLTYNIGWEINKRGPSSGSPNTQTLRVMEGRQREFPNAAYVEYSLQLMCDVLLV